MDDLFCLSKKVRREEVGRRKSVKKRARSLVGHRLCRQSSEKFKNHQKCHRGDRFSCTYAYAYAPYANTVAVHVVVL